ncbi:MAG: RNA polymerase factor sigma-54, partial [Armatimonadaceae bacterium]
WNSEELEAAIERELAENPALDLREGESLHRDHSSELTVATVSLASADSAEKSVPERILESRERKNEIPLSAAVDTPSSDPFDRMASGTSLREHLRRQIGPVLESHLDACPVLLGFLIECVDERGWLEIDPVEVCEQFRLDRPRIESTVTALQSMDPPGVGARDLRESLLLQAEFLNGIDEGNPLAVRILQQFWDELSNQKLGRIATKLRLPQSEINDAVEFLRRALTPYPGASFRSDSARNPELVASVRPDVIFRRTEAGYLVELARNYSEVLEVAELWQGLADGSTPADEAMRRYVREHVDRAESLIHGISRRGRTLRLIARELARHQVGFLETRNRAFLKPLTRQQLSESLKLDESVVSRAVADKWAQLPSGEIVPLDAFFGNSQAIRESLLRLVQEEDPANPLSDDDLANELTELGFTVARRTVAKYRGVERILPARLRKRRIA